MNILARWKTMHVIMISFLLLACGAGEVVETTPTPNPTSTIPPTSTAIPYSVFVEFSTLDGPAEGIGSLALSPDGARLAYGSYADHLVHIIDISSGQEIMTLEGHTAPVTALAFHPDGQLLASTGTVNLPPDTDGTVRIWDLTTGQQLANFKTSGTNQLAFSPNGSLLAGAAGGNPVQVSLWDVEGLVEKGKIANVFAAISFDPSGKLVASGSRDEQVHILDVSSGQEITSLAGHQGWVSATAFSPNGNLLASGSDDNSIQLWDPNTGENLGSLSGHQSQVNFVAFSPDGTVLASLANGINISREGGQLTMNLSLEEEDALFWNVESGEQIASLPGASFMAFNSDWGVVVTAGGDNLIHLWNVNP